MFKKFSEPSSNEILQAEQEIYTLLLEKQKYAYADMPDKIQVIEYTASGEFRLSVPLGGIGIFQKKLELKYFSILEKSTFLDYQKKNVESYLVKNYLLDSADVIFVNPADGKQLNWWVSFSRIGFNSSLTQALVLVGDCRGESCYDNARTSMYSSGEYIVLEKVDNKWVVKEGRSAWHIESPAP